MSQISPEEAVLLLEKLFSESVPLATFFITPSRARVRLDGFLVGAKTEGGLFVRTRPLPEEGGDWINVSPFKAGECEFWYGEEREVPEEMRLSHTFGESVLIITFLATNERFGIFFTL